jgi:hypothetical protein
MAFVASNGWVLASDRRGILQGGNWKRLSYDTDKIIYRNKVVATFYGDECAIIARDRILNELKLKPDSLVDNDFHPKMETLSRRVWKSEKRSHPALSPNRDRGIIFLAVGHKRVFTVAFGRDAVVHSSTTRWIAGDPANPIVYFPERFHDVNASMNEMALLAAYTVVYAKYFNTFGIDGLDIIGWQEGWPDAQWLDAEKYSESAKNLDNQISAIMQSTKIIP